jgi:hypothetical protein
MAPRAALLFAALALLLAAAPAAAAPGVFQVRRKFPAGGDAGGNITALRAHDGRRHGRLLAAADLKLGGLGLPTDTGYVPLRCSPRSVVDFVLGINRDGLGARRLYFTEINLGTPPKHYFLQVDTGSDILWVNCITCDECPRKSGLGVPTTSRPRSLFRGLGCRVICSLPCDMWCGRPRAARLDALRPQGVLDREHSVVRPGILRGHLRGQAAGVQLQRALRVQSHVR